MSAPYNPASLAIQDDDNEREVLLKIARILYDATVGSVPLTVTASE